MLPASCLEEGRDVCGLSPGVSAELLAAQARLIKLREQIESERGAVTGPNSEVAHGRFPLPELTSSFWPDLADLPDHLGWESASLTAVLRLHLSPHSPDHVWNWQQPTETTATVNETEVESTAVIKLYPDLALAMLRQNQVAPGRVWLLLRQLDTTGCGWVETEEARKELTGRRSQRRICGWRQLRNLLRQGEGVFWRRENGRLWLASTTKAAAALGMTRLSQPPVYLPAMLLSGPISAVRAHFYASFHSSRQTPGEIRGAPIARETLAQLANITPHTQRAYERKTGVQAQAQFAVGAACTPEGLEEAGWRRGTALFQLKDHQGIHGRPGRTYLAWQLPNRYRGPHRLAARGRQKQINRDLIDLLQKGMTGNDQVEVDAQRWFSKRYVGNGRLAANALTQSEEVYWPDPTVGHHTTPIWRTLN